jgi:pimeloyl-ACP methyl ester carboxylesterase
MGGLLCIVATVSDNMRKILILHGWGQSKELWKDLASKLEGDFEVEAVDFPGFGEEPLQAPDWGVPEYAKWLNNQVELKGYFAVIAHSFGGRVITETMNQFDWYPEKLILIGAPVVHVTDKGLRYQSVVSIAKKILPIPLQDAIAAKINPEIPDAKAAGNYESYKRIIAYDQSHQLESITSQTLLIWGELDKEAPISIAHICDEKIPNSTLKVIPNTGHNIHLEKPLLLYGTIQTFL